MRPLRGLVRFALITLVGLGCAGSARAQLLVVADSGEPPAVARAELAYAAGDGPPVTWLSLRVQRGPVAIVAALPSDAQVDAGLDAWLASLEVTVSPNVILPLRATNCGQTGSFVHVAWPRGSGVSPSELSLRAPEDVLAALAERGLSLAAELPPADHYVVWSWPEAKVEQTTRTLRIVGGQAPLALLPAAPFPLLVSSVTRGSAALPTELSNGELAVTFVAKDDPASDYRERLNDWLGARPEPLLEARARGPLFDWAIYGDTVSLGSLVSTYATRAGKERPELDTRTCAEQLRALREPGAPSAAACGDASDAALALAAAGTELPTLQRFVVSGSQGFAPDEAAVGGVASPPILRAERLDDSACPVQMLPPVGVPASGTGSGGKPSADDSTTVVVQPTVVVEETQPAEVSCGSSAPPRDDPYYDDNSSCSSDTSSSSSDSGCSSDTSSSSSDSGCSSDSSSSGDSGCSSDTSSSSSDSGCSSDSSSSSDGSDTSCDGGSDTSSGYDGDTCTGAARPGAERTQAAQAGLTSRPRAHRARRLKTSLWSVAGLALVLPIRRRKRRKRAAH